MHYIHCVPLFNFKDGILKSDMVCGFVLLLPFPLKQTSDLWAFVEHLKIVASKDDLIGEMILLT